MSISCVVSEIEPDIGRLLRRLDSPQHQTTILDAENKSHAT